MIITAAAQEAQDLVYGNLIRFNDNDAWCWYQDERAVIDVTAGKMIIGSDVSAAGVGNPSQDVHNEGIILDLNCRISQKYPFMDICTYRLNNNAAALADSIYSYRLNAGNYYRQTTKMTVPV